MISTRYRFLFIHVPKTAGNSIQNVLAEYSDDELVCLGPHQDGLERFEVRSKNFNTHKHSTFSDYRRECGDEMLKGLVKFCCVRNPWERAVSHYFSPHRGKVTWSKNEFLQFIRTDVMPLRLYLAADDSEERNLQRAITNMSYILRFETLQVDFENLCNLLGLPLKVLANLNKSHHDEYKKYYDAESAGAVFERFHDEIGHFGYALT